jgi:hypothetical protein
MEFKEVLQILRSNFGKQGFKARDVHSVIRRSITESERFKEVPTMLSKVSTKTISNELRRLYLMGVLKRKRIKRECETKSGKTCFRGYEYVYSISRQGWKYLEFLTNPERQDNESFVSSAYSMALDSITKDFPEDEWWLRWDVYKTLAENPDPENLLAVGMQLKLMMKLPRARRETAWNLWKEMNLKVSKRRFSKREGVDKALMRGAIRELKKKNEELQKVIIGLFWGKARLIEENKRLEAGLKKMGWYFTAIQEQKPFWAI